MSIFSCFIFSDRRYRKNINPRPYALIQFIPKMENPLRYSINCINSSHYDKGGVSYGFFRPGKECDRNEIVFGANMTTLTFSMSRAIARELIPGDEIVVTQLDHYANISPWLALKEQGSSSLQYR